MNKLTQKNKNFENNQINMVNNEQNSSQKSKVKKDINEIKVDLQKAFDGINEEFIYMPPIFIPLIPVNDPYDLYNEEEHL